MKIRKKMGVPPKTKNGKILITFYKTSAIAAALEKSCRSRPNVLSRRSSNAPLFKFNAPTIRLAKTIIRTFGVNVIMRRKRNTDYLEIPKVEFKNEAAYSHFMLRWS